MYFITTKRMLEVCFSVHPNIQYRTFNIDKGDGLCYFDDIHRWFSRPAGSWDVSVPNFHYI